METLKSIFKATANDCRNGCTGTSVGSAKSDLHAPKLTEGQREPVIAIPEHLFAAPDRPPPKRS